jgi:hypothetical protein
VHIGKEGVAGLGEARGYRCGWVGVMQYIPHKIANIFPLMSGMSPIGDNVSATDAA